MAATSQTPSSQRADQQRGFNSRAVAALAGAEPRQAFRAALRRYKGNRLAAIRLAQGAAQQGARIRPVGSADEITEALDRPATVEALVARLPLGSRFALSFLGLTETTSIPLPELSRAVRLLGAEPQSAIVPLLELGLLAVELRGESAPVDDFQAILNQGNQNWVRFRIHPAVPRGIRTVRPAAQLPKAGGSIAQIRESDGLEPIVRLGALWQRVRVEPLRQTNHGTLYKRDRDRLADDPVLAGPIADALQPLPDAPALWLALAEHMGLITPDPAGERILAAPPEYWTDNAVHLPQMIATGWLALPPAEEQEGKLSEPRPDALAPMYLRAAVLLWLTVLGDAEWVALDDLAAHLTALYPAWDQEFVSEHPRAASAPSDRGASGGRARVRSGDDRPARGVSLLESILLATAYPLGLVRAAEEGRGRRRVVQLTPLGRYVLAVGPTPPPRESFQHFLFVQPNFEVVAYRQGLTTQLVGQLSQFVWWSQLGSAMELKLTRESIVCGLDAGLTPESMLELLTRHSQRPLPPGVIDAVKNWATRRERVTYYAAATLIEFGSTTERDAALESWPTRDHAAPIPLADRFLLVEDERTVPFDRLRLTSSRDYRRPADVCVIVEADGVSLALDPTHTDLLVEAELSRFADPLPPTEPVHAKASMPPLRRFLISLSSLRRGMSRGISPSHLAEWFERRTGGIMPPALHLLLMAKASRVPPLAAARTVVLHLPSPVLLDGLLQHPATGPLLGERLGPTAVAIPEKQAQPLRRALKELGINFELD
jgi:hypothetical protein